MTDWEEATAWLEKHSKDLSISDAISTLKAGPEEGAATFRYVRVRLFRPGDSDLSLEGEGRSILAAVQMALGPVR